MADLLEEPALTQVEINALRQTALDLAEVGLYRYTLDGAVLFMDRVTLRIFDLESAYPDPAQVVGKNISDLFTYLRPRGGLRKEVQERGCVRRFEYPFKTLTGIQKWVVHESYLVTDPLTGEEAVQAIIRDITDRKRWEAELKDSEERFRVLFEHAPDAYYLSDLQGRLVDGNIAAEKLVGRDKAEFVGKGLLKLGLTPPQHVSGAAFGPADDMEGQPTSPGEYTIIRKDGTRVPVDIRTHPVRIKGRSLMLGVARDISERKQRDEALRVGYEKLRMTLEGTVKALAATAEKRDPYTAGHQERVARLASAIAAEMRLPLEEVEGIRLAATLHDVGKVSTPAEILSKPGALTDLEMGIIRTHPQVGYEILQSIPFDWPVAEIVLQHHERLDGSGYPAGLVGEQIRIEARLLAVADVVEAMSTHRPYRPARGVEAALEEISSNRGKLYDTGVVNACLRTFSKRDFGLG